MRAVPAYNPEQTSRKDVSVRIGSYLVDRYSSRMYAIWDENGGLIAVTVYKKGAVEVANRLTEAVKAQTVPFEKTKAGEQGILAGMQFRQVPTTSIRKKARYPGLEGTPLMKAQADTKRFKLFTWE